MVMAALAVTDSDVIYIQASSVMDQVFNFNSGLRKRMRLL